MLSDCYNERDFSLNCFLNGTGCLVSSNVDSGGIWFEFLHRLWRSGVV